jgi:hypothetical protein
VSRTSTTEKARVLFCAHRNDELSTDPEFETREVGEDRYEKRGP